MRIYVRHLNLARVNANLHKSSVFDHLLDTSDNSSPKHFLLFWPHMVKKIMCCTILYLIIYHILSVNVSSIFLTTM